MLHNSPLQQNYLLHIILVVDLSSEGALEKLDCSDNCLSYRGYFNLVCMCYDIQNKNSGRSSAVIDCSDQDSPERRTCFFLVPAYLSQVLLGPGLLVCWLCYPCWALLSLLFTLRLDAFLSVLYQALLVLCIKIFLKTHLLSWSLP